MSEPLRKAIASYSVPVRLGIFISLLLLLWLPIAIPLYHTFAQDANLVSIVTMTALYLEFLWLSHQWGQKVHGDRGLASYGLVWRRQTAIELLKGLAIGLLFTFALFLWASLCGWLTFQSPTLPITRLILEGSLTALGVGFAEELLFRGWLLAELEKDYAPTVALWSCSLLFAIAHFIKPLGEMIRTLPQFPALVLLGLTLVWAKRSCHGRLGMNIGLHAGLIWAYYIINVGQFFRPTGNVPPWVTGIDNNPLAGVLGLLFLGILAFWTRQKAQISPDKNKRLTAADDLVNGR
jgi:membrane protease YdiL (CAAX protease family)